MVICWWKCCITLIGVFSLSECVLTILEMEAAISQVNYIQDQKLVIKFVPIELPRGRGCVVGKLRSLSGQSVELSHQRFRADFSGQIHVVDGRTFKRGGHVAAWDRASPKVRPSNYANKICAAAQIGVSSKQLEAYQLHELEHPLRRGHFREFFIQ